MPDEAPKRETDAPKSPALKTLAAEKSGALDTGDTVKTAGDRLRENQASQWPVAEGRKLVGMVVEENPDWKMGGHGHDPADFKVSQIMSREVAYCFEDEDCATARRMMDERSLRVLPVVDRQMRIVGMFSREEIEEKEPATPPESGV